MTLTITDVVAIDVRFPTSASLDGSDALNQAPDYSATYVTLRTDDPGGLEGHGITFTTGRGNELCVAAVAGDARRAMEIQRKLMPVHKHLFVEANPIPLKWAMARMGLCGPAMRLPMTPLSPANAPVVEEALRASGLLA